MKFFALLLAMLLTSTVSANEAAPNAEDPVIEQRLNKMAEDLRCLVCQNESLAGSRADLAQDLRREVREQMKAGKSDEEVIKYLTDRYGDFVLYRPPFKPVTLILWLGPVIFLGIGGAIWFVTLKRRRSLQDQAQPDNETLKKAAALLEQ
jgi:cytochrome c-type biogenesis protein CcmH